MLVDALDLEVVGGLLAAGYGGEPVVLEGVGEVVSGVRVRELVEQRGGVGGVGSLADAVGDEFGGPGGGVHHNSQSELWI